MLSYYKPPVPYRCSVGQDQGQQNTIHITVILLKAFSDTFLPLMEEIAFVMSLH